MKKRSIAGPMEVDYKESAQDVHLAVNQHHKMRCGDNGIFKGTPVTAEQRDLTKNAERIYDKYHLYAMFKFMALSRAFIVVSFAVFRRLI
ncbi:MAG: hypothetical protein UFA98_06920 [Ruminococcus sp.]|nr:hypothetical protein [Ruminococcus sp.]